MTRNFVLSALGASLLLFTACKKDSQGGGGRNALSGEWDFKGVHVQATTTQTEEAYGDEYKNISETEYTSTNNAGSMTFEDSTVLTKGLSYAATATLKAAFYTNGVQETSQSTSSSFSVPAYSGTGRYKLIGSDSLYFPDGGFLSVGGVSQTPGGEGAKFSISGNSLTITVSSTGTSTQSDGPDDVLTTVEKVLVTITLQKK